MSQLKKFLNGFIYAYEGIKLGFKERNMKVHGAVAVLMLLAGAILGLDRLAWFVVLILIALVWSAELFNTAIEELANLIRTEENLSYSATRKIRDISAGAVLVIAIMAGLIGSAIFAVRILQILRLDCGLLF